MSKEVKIAGKLDKHLKPLIVDGESLPIEVAEDDIRINQGLKVQGDIQTTGNLNIQGNSINFENNTRIFCFDTEGRLDLSASDVAIQNAQSDSQFFLVTPNDKAPQLTFMRLAAANTTIGTDINGNLLISNGVDLSSEKWSINSASGNIKQEGTLKIKEGASADSDTAAYGQLWVKSDTPNNLYFTNDAGNDVQITNGSSIAGSGGGGGTQRWSVSTGGFRTNNTSTTNFYFQFRVNGENWSNVDSSPTSLNRFDFPAALWSAPADCTLTNIRVRGYTNDTGAGDAFRFYVYKSALPHNSTSNATLTLIGETDAISTTGARSFNVSKDISSSNSISDGEVLFVMLKKDANTGNQDLFFSVTISGEYS